MECDICHWRSGDRTKFLCAICAAASLYPARLALARVHAETDSPRRASNNVISNAEREQTSAWSMQQVKAAIVTSESATSLLREHTRALCNELQHMRLDIAKRRARLVQRKKDMNNAQSALETRKANRWTDLQRVVQTTKQRLEEVRQEAITLRLSHCVQVARLYSLQQHRRRRSSGIKEVYYSIAFIPIADLRDLNDESPLQLTAALTHTANLVYQLAHHLSLRLPAQILLPTSQFSFATILSPAASYTKLALAFPRSTPTHSLRTSPAASRRFDTGQTQAHPRPLYLVKKLSVLAKEDVQLYSYVVEGLSLLAWDVAWLCRTQGLDVGGTRWEDVPAMGKHLSALISRCAARLQHDSHPPALAPLHTAQPGQEATRTGEAVQPGTLSHATAHATANLAANFGSSHMASWKLHNFIKVINKVKQLLLAERTGAEWELLSTQDWAGAEFEAADLLQEEHVRRQVQLQEQKPELERGKSQEIDRRERQRDGGGGVMVKDGAAGGSVNNGARTDA